MLQCQDLCVFELGARQYEATGKFSGSPLVKQTYKYYSYNHNENDEDQEEQIFRRVSFKCKITKIVLCLLNAHQ